MADRNKENDNEHVYVCIIMIAVYRRLLTTHLHDKAAVVANKHWFKAIILKCTMYSRFQIAYECKTAIQTRDLFFTKTAAQPIDFNS